MAVERPPGSVFEELAAGYDAWYDSAPGRALFELELACLRPLLARAAGPCLEVGTGTGRFAAALGCQVGLDLWPGPLRLAARRGVAVVQGRGEHLPFTGGCFGLVALVATLCFAEDPVALLSEAQRALAPSGRLVVGLVPLDSAWGHLYEQLGRSGHPFYRVARFLPLAEHVRLLARAGFGVVGARSTLAQAPSEEPSWEPPQEGMVPGAGFVALEARPSAT